MASTRISRVLHGRWWLQWTILYVVSMHFYSLGRLVAMAAVLDMVTTSTTERTASATTDGVILGILQDLVTTTLLVAALVAVDVLGVSVSQLLAPRVRDHLLTVQTLRRLGLFTRFALALTLAVVWLAYFVVDLLLVCSLGIRLTTSYDSALSETLARDRRQVFFWGETIDPRPSDLDFIERTRISSSSDASNPTPPYTPASFVVFACSPSDANRNCRSPSDDAIDAYRKRHVTIVSVRRLADLVQVDVWQHHLRAYNKMADAAANIAMDDRASYQVQHPSDRPHAVLIDAHLASDVQEWRARRLLRLAKD